MRHRVSVSGLTANCVGSGVKDVEGSQKWRLTHSYMHKLQRQRAEISPAQATGVFLFSPGEHAAADCLKELQSSFQHGYVAVFKNASKQLRS